MTLTQVQIVFQVIVLLFAISFHESAHAWMASRRGDPTARMLGRITLNPIKHVDPVGTVLLPIICIATGLPVFGWAKPTPVDPRNFKQPVLDDVLTSLAGPVSNFLLVVISAIVLAILVRLPQSTRTGAEPLAVFFYVSLEINVLLGLFNLLPVPPLDGSHVFRHLLPERMQRIYDTIGMIGLVVVFLFAGRILAPAMNFVITLILAVIGVRQ